MVINNSDSVGFPTLESTACDSRGILKLNQSLINKSDLHELYRVDKGAPFATGLYAQVRRCTVPKSLRPTGSQKQPSQPYYAAKFSPRKRPGHSQNEDCVESLHEIALLCQLKNPYIISFKDAFILDDFIVTIMEFAPGGDLQSVIDADLVLLEKDASRFVYQLLEALKYLHSRHIAHLDIKPQNLLLMGEFPSCDIKLCDFEISRVIRPGMEIREILGTPDYVAPEILLYEPLSTFCDMWSVGILTYVLLTGFSPFGGDTDQETFRNIINEPIDFPEELFEDVSPAAINFIEKLAVKNGRVRPSAQDMELHEWVCAYVSPQESSLEDVVSVPPPPAPKEASVSNEGPAFHYGPKKRSPRKASAMSGCSTASASPVGRRQSARSILRACKSAYDLNKMGGKTKSREVLIEKMRIATGEPSGMPWKLRKNLSKSREQLWESKIQLSKSCEKINNFPGSSRWASVANFPSLDMNAKKCSTSQESVISVMSTSTNVQQLDMTDWQQQQCAEDNFPYSVSMPGTPPLPNFDLSHNNGYHESSPPIMTNNFSGLQTKINSGTEFSGYPSLASSSGTNGEAQYLTANQAANVTTEEAQKSVAELIMTFGGRVSKKLDLKNKFEPILECEGSEEQPMSLGDCSDNNSTSGVSSIVPTSNTSKDSIKNNHGDPGKQSDHNSASTNGKHTLSAANKTDTGQEPHSGNNSRRNSKTNQQITEDMNRSERRHNRSETYYSSHSPRRGSMSPPKNTDGTTLKGILKKPKQPDATSNLASTRTPEFPNPSTARRGSIPSNCRLYEQHTISSSAKAPRRSILRNGTSQSNNASTPSTTATSDKHSKSLSSTSQGTSNKSGSTTTERSSSRSPENNSTKHSSPPKDKEEGSVEDKNENLTDVSSTIITNNSSSDNNNTAQLRQSRPTSILITSNADNKLEPATSPRRQRPLSADFNSLVITSEKEKAFDKEMRVESSVHRSRQHSRKRHEPIHLESNSSGNKGPDSPTTDEGTIPVAPPMSMDAKEFNMKRNSSASSVSSTTIINKQLTTTQKTQDGLKSQWGVVCTGSVVRAKERFESVRSKLRRGSVPDF